MRVLKGKSFFAWLGFVLAGFQTLMYSTIVEHREMGVVFTMRETQMVRCGIYP